MLSRVKNCFKFNSFGIAKLNFRLKTLMKGANKNSKKMFY